MNAGAIATGSILAIGGITVWRLLRGGPSLNKVRSVWAAAALALLISLMADLDAGLGAAFGGAFAVYTLLGRSPLLGTGGSSPAPAPPRPPRGVVPTAAANAGRNATH
jgi:hypothetical protein